MEQILNENDSSPVPTCNECKSKLDDDECASVKLSCGGNSICQKHLNDDISREYKCSSCNASHHMSEVNESEQKEASSEQMEKEREAAAARASCPDYQNALNSIMELEKLLKEFEALQKDPAHFISQKIGQLKAETNLIRDELKAQVDEEAADAIRELDGFIN
jgi:hypothetical protein